MQPTPRATELSQTDLALAGFGYLIYLLGWLFSPIGLFLGIAYGSPLTGLLLGIVATLLAVNPGMSLIQERSRWERR